jgi:hypothetical protein
MISLLSVINFIIVLILILIITLLILYNKNINNKIINLKNNLKEKVLSNTYPKQALENYFLDDIYKDLPDDKRVATVETDYFVCFIKCIDSIINNKNDFINIFMKLDDPSSLQYKFYIPVVKFAKYSIDYENYLEQTSQQRFLIRIVTKYRHFKDDPKYFVILNNGKRRVHILYFITKAIDLYNNYKTDVDNCIFHNICAVSVVQQNPPDVCAQCRL